MRPPDPAVWGVEGAVRPLTGGAREGAWLVDDAGIVLKRTAWSEPGLRWLVPVLWAAERAGFAVPRMLVSPSGAFAVGGWRAETLLAGRSARPAELRALAPAARRFHAMTRALPQRPGWTRMLHGPYAQAARSAPGPVIHGDLNPGNVLIGERPGLIDWEKARRDDAALDLLALGEPGVPRNVRRAHLMREIALGWQAEPDRARRLARRF